MLDQCREFLVILAISTKSLFNVFASILRFPRTPFIHNIDPRGINRMCRCEQKQSRNGRETAPNMM